MEEPLAMARLARVASKLFPLVPEPTCEVSHDTARSLQPTRTAVFADADYFPPPDLRR
jgi:hypothetical protein